MARQCHRNQILFIINRILFSVLSLTAVMHQDILAKEPQNIYFAKQELAKYCDSGEYHNDIEKVVAQAKRHIKERVKNTARDEKLALILDIDDTALSTHDYRTKFDFGFNKETFEKSIAKGKLKTIPATVDLYNFAKANNIAVFFVSWRSEALRTATSNNLKLGGYNNWDGLYLKPSNCSHGLSIAFKSGVRKRITAKGYTIVANIGDQHSDLDASCVNCNFKLPNPFYLVQ